jgi:hypothetical protein
MIRTRLAIGAVLLWLPVAHAAAQTPRDQIAAGYALMNGGDPAAASRHFETLQKAVPNDLAVRFGWLMAERDSPRLRCRRMPSFEKALDAIIDLAGTRYGRTTKDTEALFYLANAHLMRAAFRFDHDRGMWGAARDGANAKSTSTSTSSSTRTIPTVLRPWHVQLLRRDPADVFQGRALSLFIPAGNRVEGAQADRAVNEERVLRPLRQADVMDIYNEFEAGRTTRSSSGEELRT